MAWGRSGLATIALLALAACGGPAEPVWAPDTAVDAARFQSAGPSKVTLFTVRSVGSGSGAHAGLMIAGSERVLFDPAGTFRHPRAPERNDVHFGITDDVLDVYIDYHARASHDVEILEIEVTRSEADALIGEVTSYGAVPKAQCSLAITRVLSRQDRFASMEVTYFPGAAARRFAALPSTSMRVVTDYDAPDNHGVLIRARDELEAMGLTPVN
ncbi:MAG: hypothetical protein AAF871_12410 [Pseudomonadota bacterium]